ncbi:MAG: glycoside hydrolase family 127 protein [Hydrogeniiclostridium sp.]
MIRGVHHNRASFPRYMGEYAQDHCPIELQSEAVGHAVRAALMYTGLAAVGMETGDRKYLDAAKRLWDSVVTTKLHISGGIGVEHKEEKFGSQYDLPNDAYLETCTLAAPSQKTSGTVR